MSYYIAAPFLSTDKISENYLRLINKKLNQDFYLITQQFKKIITQQNFQANYKKDSIVDDIEEITQELSKILENRIEFQEIYKTAESVMIFVKKQISKILANKTLIYYDFNISVNLFEKEFSALSLLIDSWAKANVKKIKLLSENQLNDIAQIISAAFRAGSSYETIAKNIQEKVVLNKNKAKLIARTEIAALNSDLIRNESLKYGFNLYLWDTSNDERVRKSHEVLNKKICCWLNPKIFKYKLEDKKWFLKTILPGSYKRAGKTENGGEQAHCGHAPNCRCTASIIIDLSKYKRNLYIT